MLISLDFMGLEKEVPVYQECQENYEQMLITMSVNFYCLNKFSNPLPIWQKNSAKAAMLVYL